MTIFGSVLFTVFALVQVCLFCISLSLYIGAEVLVSDEDGRSPLYWAAYNGKYKLAEHLLQKGEFNFLHFRFSVFV